MPKCKKRSFFLGGGRRGQTFTATLTKPIDRHVRCCNDGPVENDALLESVTYKERFIF